MKVVNIGNIAEAYICDELPAMGVVIEATLDELERLPNLTYKEVTISATPRRNCERFASAEEAWTAMTKPLITLPCTAQELENALHAACDHDGIWNAKIFFCICDRNYPPSSPWYYEHLEIQIETKGETK